MVSRPASLLLGSRTSISVLFRGASSSEGARTDFLDDALNPVQGGILPATPTANLRTWLGIDEYFTRTDARGVQDVLLDALGVLEHAIEDLSGPRVLMEDSSRSPPHRCRLNREHPVRRPPPGSLPGPCRDRGGRRKTRWRPLSH